LAGWRRRSIETLTTGLSGKIWQKITILSLSTSVSSA
jgi:hypothetical protein